MNSAYVARCAIIRIQLQLSMDTVNERALVTVAGQIGSGKTAVCKEIAQRTGWAVVSAGGILRKMAQEHGMSVLDFNEYVKNKPDIDASIDNYLASLKDSPDSLLIDSRLAWHFLPMSIKTYLVVDPRVGAGRVFAASRADEDHASIETAIADIQERHRLEQERFQALYSVNLGDWRNYDLIVETTGATPAEVADKVLEYVRGPRTGQECWLAGKSAGEFVLSSGML